MNIPPHIISQVLSYATMLKLSMAKEFGLNGFQFLSLLMVGSIGGLSIKDLRRQLSVPGSTLTSTLDSLEKKKLIKRQRSKEDRRQWLLLLTAKGERLCQEIIKAEGNAMAPSLEKLSQAENITLMRLASEISKNYFAESAAARKNI